MSDEQPSVIDLRSRQPYEGPAPVPDPDMIDRGSILVMQELIKRFEDGELSGCVIMPWNRHEKTFERIICIPANESVSEASLKYSGGLHLMNDDLLNMHLIDDEGVEEFME